MEEKTYEFKREQKEDPFELDDSDEKEEVQPRRIATPSSQPPSKKIAAPSSDRFWKIATVILIVLLGIFVLKGNEKAPTGGVVIDEPKDNPAPTVNMKQLVDDDPFLGKEGAPITIVEFSDYQCPYCGRFYTQTLPLIKSNYIDTGKVKFVYRDFPLSFHPEATPAALATNCAGEQGKFWEFHDKVYRSQDNLSSENYQTWAGELGLDLDQWGGCLTDPEQAAEIRKDFNDGGTAGVSGTPAFFINGNLVSGAQPFTVFQQIIEAELS